MTFNLQCRLTARSSTLRAIPLLSRYRQWSNLQFSSINATSFQQGFGQDSYMELTQMLYERLKDCVLMKSVSGLRKIHGQVVSLGLDASVFVQNNLVNSYVKCGLVHDAYGVFYEMGVRNVHSWNAMIDGFAKLGMMRVAYDLFDEMPERDTVTWNLMMARFFNNGRPGDTLRMFSLMIRDSRCCINLSSYSCALKACGSLGNLAFASQLHGLVEKSCLREDYIIQGSIVDAYIKCGAMGLAETEFLGIMNPSLFCRNSMIYCYSKLYGVTNALNLFLSMPEHNAVSWNMIVSILSQHGMEVETLSMFVDMSTLGFRSYSETYASVLRSCATLGDINWGAHLHARVIRLEPRIDVFAGGGLIDMYWKCRQLGNARKVFDGLSQRNAVCWTSFIGVVASFGLEDEALKLYNEMRSVYISPDCFTLSLVLGICSNRKDITYGRQLHGQTIKLGMESSIAVGNSILTVYTKCADISDATQVFHLMPKKDIVSWTLMINAFSQIGDIGKAREHFNIMSERNIVTWNSILSGYIQNELQEEGMKMYIQLLKEEGIRPDWITLVTCMTACADLAVMSLGSQVIAQAEKNGLSSDVSVANSFITFYSRSGQIELGEKVFNSIGYKNLISWNSMMSGFAHNGQGSKALDIFEKMLSYGFLPDLFSFASVLSGCSHAGLVLKGKHYFHSMTNDYNLSPEPEHYTCMVDLLGRAGLLEQAFCLIKDMPFKPNADIWKALLSACCIHVNAESAEFALQKLLDLNAEDSGSYTLLANVYWKSRKLQGVAALRRLIRDNCIAKHPASSWIEVNNKIHIFTAHDVVHPQLKDIHRVLEELHAKVHPTPTRVSLLAIQLTDSHPLAVSVRRFSRNEEIV